MNPETPALWRFSLSGTVRGIYVMRYFLFSGGTAIAGALVERRITHTDRLLLGFLLGFAVGLVLFRSQFRRLFAPTLFLGQQSLHLVGRGLAAAVPWETIREVRAHGRRVTLNLSRPVRWANKEVEAVDLHPRWLGVGTQFLAERLNTLSQDPSQRLQLPSEMELT